MSIQTISHNGSTSVKLAHGTNPEGKATFLSFTLPAVCPDNVDAMGWVIGVLDGSVPCADGKKLPSIVPVRFPPRAIIGDDSLVCKQTPTPKELLSFLKARWGIVKLETKEKASKSKVVVSAAANPAADGGETK